MEDIQKNIKNKGLIANFTGLNLKKDLITIIQKNGHIYKSTMDESPIDESVQQIGGTDGYKIKYLKYKQKYLNLKN